MRSIEYFVVRYGLLLLVAGISAPPLLHLMRHLEAHERRALTIFVAVTTLAYLYGLSWFTKKTAEHMAFEDRKFGAALRFALWDLRLRMGFLPFIGNWFVPPPDKRDKDEERD